MKESSEGRRSPKAGNSLYGSVVGDTGKDRRTKRVRWKYRS